MRALIAVLLECLAVALAFARGLSGVRTDEAKYLLNIPYPHPPLGRWILWHTEPLPFQEMLWRVLLASLLVHAVWIVWDIGHDLSRAQRWTLVAGWLLSAGVITQAGSILMAPITALLALVFLWCAVRPAILHHGSGWTGLLWLASVFTAYQAVLFLPLVWSTLRKGGYSRALTAAITLMPIMLLALYTLANPLAFASIAGLGGDIGTIVPMHRLFELLRILLIGGSGAFAVLGIAGAVRSRALAATLAFLMLYTLASHAHEYYAVLFVPLFVGGAREYFTHASRTILVLPAVVLCGVLVTTAVYAIPPPSPARAVLHALREKTSGGIVLIAGPFGHEWQYEGSFDIRRFEAQLLPRAEAVVCLQACPGVESWSEEWEKLENVPGDVWVKQKDSGDSGESAMGGLRGRRRL